MEDIKSVKKERIEAFEFVRAISALGIISFHFSCHSNSTFKPLFYYQNGNYGIVFVTVFFMISGAMLYYNYENGINLKSFYYKRWKSIYPMFYIAFLWYYFEKVFENSSWFYNGNPKSLLLTVLGMDGYFSYRVNDYFLVGEWFVGAIVITYILFPLMLKIFNKSDSLMTVIVIALYLIMQWMYHMGWLRIQYHQNICVCMLSFELGMVAIKYKKALDNKITFIVALACAMVIIGIKLSFLSESIAGHLLGIALFILFYFIGNKVMHIGIIKKIVMVFSGLSYPIFLIQHQVILKVLAFRNPVSVLYSVAVFVFILVLILVEAKILELVTSAVLNSKLYLGLENIGNNHLEKN